MGKELCLENTTNKRIWLLLGTDDDGKPVILEIGSADRFYCTNRNGTLRRNGQLVVNDTLHYDVEMSTSLINYQ